MSNCTDSFGLFKNSFNQWKVCSWLDTDWKLKNNCGVAGLYEQSELGSACQATCWPYNGCPPLTKNSTMVPTVIPTRKRTKAPSAKPSMRPSNSSPSPTKIPRQLPTTIPLKHSSTYPTKYPSLQKKSEPGNASTFMTRMHPTNAPTTNTTIVSSSRNDITTVYTISLACTLFVLFVTLVLRSLLQNKTKKGQNIAENIVQETNAPGLIHVFDPVPITSKSTDDRVNESSMNQNEMEMKQPSPNPSSDCDWLSSSCIPQKQEAPTLVQVSSIITKVDDGQVNENDRTFSYFSSSIFSKASEDNPVLPTNSLSKVGFWEGLHKVVFQDPSVVTNPKNVNSREVLETPPETSTESVAILKSASNVDSVKRLSNYHAKSEVTPIYRSWFRSFDESNYSCLSKSDVESVELSMCSTRKLSISHSDSKSDGHTLSHEANPEAANVEPKQPLWRKLFSPIRPTVCCNVSDSTESSSVSYTGSVPSDQTWSSVESEPRWSGFLDEIQHLFHITSNSQK